MRVAIVGGGPAGLYLALLLKSRSLAESVTVYEKNLADATFGFGIVFSGRTLATLDAADAPSARAIRDGSVTWTDVIVGHNGESLRIGGNDFAGVSRQVFLDALRDRCRALDVDLRYAAAVTDPTMLEDADLVVGADGVGSVVRQAYADRFGPRLDERKNPYVWLGTARRFDGLAMLFRPSPAGVFVAHAYEYGPAGSTFVVECAGDTYARAGLDRLPEAEALAYLEGVFADDLQGAPLVAKDYRWIRFVMLSNQSWSYRNVVLLGDALHTAHFSIGSGTKLALDDAIALAEAIGAAGRVEDALVEFERSRKPDVAALQEASYASLRWLEGIDADMHLEPIPFAYKLMTRSGRVDDESLRRRDPEFMAAVDAHSWP